MATRECTYCGETFDNAGKTVGQAIFANCNHAGYLRAIRVNKQAGNNFFFSKCIEFVASY